MLLTVILFASAFSLATIAAVYTQAQSMFYGFNGLLCVVTEFVETHSEVTSKLDCAALCLLTQDCQAFSVADGQCQLFVFHRCSKGVRDCSCSSRAQLFVVQQPGLPPGALCPAGFTDDFCGTKYKVYGGLRSWTEAKAVMDAERGLTIMADVIDKAEMTHMNNLFSKYSLQFVNLGGRQLPGSSEPAGGWYWVSCNIKINTTLWYPGQPDNAGGVENYMSGGTFFSGLNDMPESRGDIAGSMGECLSPFD